MQRFILSVIGAFKHSWPSAGIPRWKAAMALIMLMLVAPAMAQSVVERLYGGAWTADQRSNGGMGDRFSFHRDGEFTYSFGPIIDMRYSVMDNVIRAVAVGPDGKEEPMNFTFVYEGDMLVLNGGDPGTRMELHRSSEFKSSSAQSLLGAWDFRHPMGMNGRFRFSGDGMAQMILTMRSSYGQYSIDQDELTLVQKDIAAPQRLRFRFDGDKLVLITERAGETKEKALSHFVVRPGTASN